MSENCQSTLQKTWGDKTALVLETLRDLGPMTMIELCRHLDLRPTVVSGILNRLHKASKRLPKRIYIISYERDDEFCKDHIRARFALGDKRDARRPKAKTKAEVTRDYTARKKSLVRMNSVFSLGANPFRIQMPSLSQVGNI